MKARIIHSGETEAVAWETCIPQWLSFQAIQFEYPRVKGEKEYVFEVQDNKGSVVFTKKISSAELTKK
jgi:hypothetical protein